MTLNHFMEQVSFYASWKHLETSGFLMYFREFIKKPYHEMGQIYF